jgi:hypothetical protein
MAKTRVWLLFAAVIALLLAVLLISNIGYQSRAVRGLVKLGDVETPALPIYREWVDSLDACLMREAPSFGHTRYDEKARYFVGSVIPVSWLNPGATGGDYGAYTNTRAHLVFFLTGQLDRAGFIHEAWHLAHGEGHPKALFSPPICGMSPAS